MSNYIRTEKHKEISKNNLAKYRELGGQPWNKGMKGIHLSPKSEYKKGRQDDKRYSWRGEDACYSGIHAWVVRWKGRPDKCEKCGVIEKNNYKIHWANIDHNYRRILDDYIRMCYRCHLEYDRKFLGRKQRCKKQ